MKSAAVVMMFSAVLLLPMLAWSGGDRECTMKDLQQASSADFAFPDWKKLYESYARYRHCDQGGDASEGYSEGVVRLLANDWDKLPELAMLSQSHKGFKTFVLRHIDATTNNDDLTKVIRLSEDQCPTDAVLLCRAINARSKKAIKDGG